MYEDTPKARSTVGHGDAVHAVIVVMMKMYDERKIIVVDFCWHGALACFLILERLQKVHRQTLNREKDIDMLISQELDLKRVRGGNDLGWSE